MSRLLRDADIAGEVHEESSFISEITTSHYECRNM